MRVVFFLGAGFSRSAGFPLMHEFSMFSQNMEGFEEHILCLHACIEYAQRTRAYIHGDIYNVEYLMSVLALAAITTPEFKPLAISPALAKAFLITKSLIFFFVVFCSLTFDTLTENFKPMSFKTFFRARDFEAKIILVTSCTLSC